MDSLLEKYRDQWSMLITADDYKYSASDLPAGELRTADGSRVSREDFEVSMPQE
jgi:hypothetical protein